MRKCGDYGYKAEKGKHFVLTERGKEWASYKNYEVGKPIDNDDTWASVPMIEDGALIEVDDPDWVVLPGFRVVYDYKGNQIGCGNPHVFHDREMAERYMNNYMKYSWFNEKAYITDAVYEGKRPVPNKEYKGKRVFVSDNWFGNVGVEGDLVEDKVVDWFANCVPPRTFKSYMVQCGEPSSSCVEGQTYATFVKIDDDVWEYKGDCLGGTTEHGTPISVVA